MSEQSASAAHCEPRTETNMFGIRTSDRKQDMKIFIYYSRIFKFVYRIVMKIKFSFTFCLYDKVRIEESAVDVRICIKSEH